MQPITCNICLGRKTILNLGMIRVDCDKCEGTGKIDQKDTNKEELKCDKGVLLPIESYIDTEEKKRRGRPPKSEL